MYHYQHNPRRRSSGSLEFDQNTLKLVRKSKRSWWKCNKALKPELNQTTVLLAFLAGVTIVAYLFRNEFGFRRIIECRQILKIFSEVEIGVMERFYEGTDAGGTTFDDIKRHFFELHPKSLLFGSEDSPLRDFMFMQLVDPEMTIAIVDWDRTLISLDRDKWEVWYSESHERKDLDRSIWDDIVQGDNCGMRIVDNDPPDTEKHHKYYDFCFNREFIDLKQYLQKKEHFIIYTATNKVFESTIKEIMKKFLGIEGEHKLIVKFKEADASKNIESITEIDITERARILVIDNNKKDWPKLKHASPIPPETWKDEMELIG